MGYAFVAFIFLGFYFIIKGRIDKKTMLNAAKKYADKIQSQRDIKIYPIRLRKTDFNGYLFDPKSQSFNALTKNKNDIKIQELDYKSLVRFINLMEKKTIDVEYFQHKGFRHLLYPIISDSKTHDLIIIESQIESINDLFKSKTYI